MHGRLLAEWCMPSCGLALEPIRKYWLSRFVLCWPGSKPLALELYKIVCVIGLGVRASKIIHRVEAKFGVIKRLDDDLAEMVESGRVQAMAALCKAVVEKHDYVACAALVRAYGYGVRQVGFFKAPRGADRKGGGGAAFRLSSRLDPMGRRAVCDSPSPA